VDAGTTSPDDTLSNVIEPNGGILARALTRRIWREGMWVGAGQAAMAFGSFAALKLLTTLLSVADYGRFALLLGLVTLGSSLFVVPNLQAVLRFYPEALGQGSVRALRRMTLDRLLRGAAILSLALALGGAAWTVASSSPIPVVSYVLAAAFLAADIVRGLEMSLLNAARRQRDYAIRGAADAWARPLMVCAAIALFGPGLSQVFLGYATGSILTSLALRTRTVQGERSAVPWRDDPWVRANRHAFVRYGLPLIPLAALNWVMSLGDRYLLGGIMGASAVGTYAAAYALGSQPLIAANQLVHTTLRPVLYDAVAEDDRAKERRTLRVWLALTVGIAALGTTACAVLAPALTRGLLGPRFGDAAHLVPWIALAYGFQVVQQTFEIMMYAHGMTRRLMALQALAAAAATIFYLLLIPKYGALGAAWGTLATFVLTCATAAVMASAPRRLMGSEGT
jgi:O-antigen/teichoic acid export membrane protein